MALDKPRQAYGMMLELLQMGQVVSQMQEWYWQLFQLDWSSGAWFGQWFDYWPREWFGNARSQEKNARQLQTTF